MRSLNNQTVGEAIGHEMILAVLFASQDNLDSEALTEISQSRLSGLTGAKPMPQLPMTTLVTPCAVEGER